MGAPGNDFHVINLYLKPLTSGMDDNVPPWHTREAVSVLREWNPDADVMYVPGPDRRHTDYSHFLQVC